MRRISCFRRQACVAQKKLTAIAEGRTDARLQMQCLSKLHTQYITSYQIIVTESDSKEDNFIDCGPANSLKDEIDIDDVPLSELQSYESDRDEILEAPLNGLKDHTEDIKKKKIKTRKVKKKLTEKYFKISKIDEEEMRELRRIRSENSLYVTAEYKCDKCLEIYSDEKDLDKHNDNLHIEKPDHLQCDICKVYIPTASVQDHRNTHYQKYTCHFCEYTSQYVGEMGRHLRNHSLKIGAVLCKGQKKTVQVKNPGSKPHRNRIMTDKRTPYGFKCPDCDKYFDNKNLRYKHIRRYHSEGFSCSVCGKRYPFKDNLIKHERLHQGPLPREECPTCHKMIRSDLLKTHARIHSARETITCVECDRIYISRASYENHLKYSQAHASKDVLKYKCSMCDKGYRSKGELRDHVNYQHLGKTQHKCPICGKALATRRCITRHVRRAHHDIKESPRDKICQQCGKAFRDKKGLREHEFIHTGERPLSCEICGCTFRQSASLYTHRKRVHKIYPQKKNVELVEVE